MLDVAYNVCDDCAVDRETNRGDGDMRKYLSCAETAKLVRQAVKEAFPGIKFSVRSSVYSGGASIDVSWIDGPTGKQVDAVVQNFSGAYFDGMIDYKGSRYHKLDGQPVSFGADFIFAKRDYSDALIAKGIAAVVAAYGGCEPISVDQYKRGDSWNWKNSGNCDLGRALQGWFSGVSDFSRLVPDPGMPAKDSPTLDRVKFAGDDGYGRGTVGSDPANPSGESCYKAIEENRARQQAMAQAGLS